MKKILVIAAVLFALVLFPAFSAGFRDFIIVTPERSIDGDIPAFIRAAVNAAPKDAVVSIASAQGSRFFAQAAAFADITLRLQIIAEDMVAAYIAEADSQAALEFQRELSTELSRRVITDASFARQYSSSVDGLHWAVLTLPRNAAAAHIISAAKTAADLVPDTHAAMWAPVRLDKAFARSNEAPLKVQHFCHPARGEQAMDIPDFIMSSIRNVSHDTIVGIGDARMANITISRSVATTRAMADISRQLEIIAMDMVVDYLASYETEPWAALAFLNRGYAAWFVQGASVINEGSSGDRGYWVAMALSASNVGTVIQSNSDRLVPGASAAMWSSDRMDAALRRNNQALWE